MPGIQNSKDTLDFLGTLGNKDKGDDLARTTKAVTRLAGLLIGRATANLQKGGNIASGATAASMEIVNVTESVKTSSCDIQILSTYKFLDQGVKGTEGGSGKYSFKTKYPSKKMATAILKWARKRAMTGRIKYKGKGRSETKSKEIHKTVSSANNLKSLAYAISTNIKKKGIKRTKFFSEAVDYAAKKQKQIYGDAFKLDIIESLNSLNL